MKKTKNNFAELIESKAPENSDVYLHDIEDFCLDISWLLNNDPNRPNKRSRKFRFIISMEKLEDYIAGNENTKSRFETKVSKEVENVFKNIDPDHNDSQMQGPPTETIHIKSQITY